MQGKSYVKAEISGLKFPREVRAKFVGNRTGSGRSCPVKERAMTQQGRRSFVQFEELPETAVLLEDRYIFADDSAIRNTVRDLEANSASYKAVLTQMQTMNLNVSSFADAPPSGWTTLTKDIYGNDIRSLTLALSLGTSDGGADVGLMGVVVQGVDENGAPMREERFEIVEVPSGGELEQGKVTLAIQNGQSVDFAAGNIFTRFVACVRKSCGSVCLGSLTACAGVFPVYLKCVAVACGGCALKCGACAACSCGFWCKWAVGCCN